MKTKDWHLKQFQRRPTVKTWKQLQPLLTLNEQQILLVAWANKTKLRVSEFLTQQELFGGIE